MYQSTDAALLLAIGWPAFGTHDEKLYENTLNKCIRHLEGKYGTVHTFYFLFLGLRRFLRDGYRTELEDSSKKFYDPEETYNFRGIENQFPLFLLCISLTGNLFIKKFNFKYFSVV